MNIAFYAAILNGGNYDGYSHNQQGKTCDFMKKKLIKG